MLYNDNVWYQTVRTTAMTKKISSIRSQEARSSAPGPQPASIANRFCPGMKPSGTSSWPPGKRQHANLKKKSIQRGKEEQPLQGSCKFKWLQHHWLRDSGWFLMILGGSCNSILLLHILHGQERHKRCSASRDPHWPAAQLLRFPREWGPERKPGCGWLPVNSMYQSEGESILQLWAPNGITLVPSCHRLSEENLCKTWSIACTDMQGNVLIGTYRCCPKPGPLRLTCKCPTRFPERLLLSPVRAKTCQDYSRKSKNQPVPHMSWTEITGLNSMTKRSLIIGLSSLLPVVVAACIRPAIHTAGTANTFTIAIGNQCL